jgi:cysteine desulfurase
VQQALRPDTFLVSVMQVNNELGCINDVAAIGAVCRQHPCLFHVDAAQGAGKVVIDVDGMSVDLLSLSAHKFYGPKGIGALYVRRAADVKIAAQIHGGGHERGLRSGTLPTHQCVGMGEAAALAQASLSDESARIEVLRDRLWKGIADLPGVQLNGHLNARVCGHLNVAFGGCDGETLLLSLRDLAVSSGSACNSASMSPSYVLKAIGLTDELAQASLRFSVGRYTTDEEIDFAIAHIRQVVGNIRG